MSWIEEFPDAQDLWVKGTERCRIQLPDSSMLDGPRLTRSNEQLERAVVALRGSGSGGS